MENLLKVKPKIQVYFMHELVLIGNIKVLFVLVR